MLKIRLFTTFLFILLQATGFASFNTHVMEISLIQTSQKLLLAAKKHDNTDSLTNLLQQLPEVELKKQLANDTDKKVFWINLYNAYTQILLSKNPEKYQNRRDFFGDKSIEIAGRLLSLDDIEHGLLRRSKTKWSMGYVNKLFPSAFERKHRVERVDYRIHFSLNCGAKSCPPIAFYQPAQLEKQLDLATKVYLTGEAEFKTDEQVVNLPAIMGWFRADFGGKKQMIKLLHQLGIVPADQHPQVKFKSYNWELFLTNYTSE